MGPLSGYMSRKADAKGVTWYFVADHYTGTIIVLTGMAFKFFELVIRIFKL